MLVDGITGSALADMADSRPVKVTTVMNLSDFMILYFSCYGYFHGQERTVPSLVDRFCEKKSKGGISQ